MNRRQLIRSGTATVILASTGCHHEKAYGQGQKQTQRRGVMSPTKFRKEDFDVLHKWNVNLVRWQMEAPKQLSGDASWMSALLDEASKAVEAAASYGIQVVLDVHNPPGGRSSFVPRAFDEKASRDGYLTLWEALSRRFRGNPAIYGYDLINEPVESALQSVFHASRSLQLEAAQHVRRIDPTTPIVFETSPFDAASSYASLQPIPLSNVIYEVHMYEPAAFTNQGLHEDLAGHTYTYPGVIKGRMEDISSLRSYLQPVRDFQVRTNQRIYCGEFSALRWAPGAASWLSDVIQIMEEWGWDWTYHAFREWEGWDLEVDDLPYDLAKARNTGESDRLKVLLAAFARNNRT